MTLLSSGVLMTSPADHVYDPFCLCGEGEGWTASLRLHWLLPHPRFSGMPETAQDFSLATGPVPRSRFCRGMWLQYTVSKHAHFFRTPANFGLLWSMCGDNIRWSHAMSRVGLLSDSGLRWCGFTARKLRESGCPPPRPPRSCCSHSCPSVSVWAPGAQGQKLSCTWNHLPPCPFLIMLWLSNILWELGAGLQIGKLFSDKKKIRSVTSKDFLGVSAVFCENCNVKCSAHLYFGLNIHHYFSQI